MKDLTHITVKQLQTIVKHGWQGVLCSQSKDGRQIFLRVKNGFIFRMWLTEAKPEAIFEYDKAILEEHITEEQAWHTINLCYPSGFTLMYKPN